MEEKENTQQAGFDYRVHISDPKTGRLIKFQPYHMVIKDGVTKIERPIGSGNWFYENGEPVKTNAKKEAGHESKTDSTT
jgi:hypothetical protein